MEEKEILYQGSTIFYRKIGEGKTVVLLHGFAEDGNVFDYQIAALKNNFQLLVPDLPGSGKSAFLAGVGLETYADIVKEIAEIEQVKDFALIGHSMGGYTALAFAEKYPQYLNSLGLFHSSAFADSEEKKEIRQKAIELIKKNGAYPFIKNTIPSLFNETYYKDNEVYINKLFEAGKEFTETALTQYYEAMIARPDRTDILRNLPKPILFIIGEHDKAIFMESSLQQCYLPAQSHVHILSKSAHMGMYEEREKANMILLDFLADL